MPLPIALPAPVGTWEHDANDIAAYAVIVGDITGDGVPDLYLYNQVAYQHVFAGRMTNGRWELDPNAHSVIPGHGYSPNSRRQESWRLYGIDDAVMADVDLDGTSELITVRYGESPEPELRLAAYDVSVSAGSMTITETPWVGTDLDTMFSGGTTGHYFLPSNPPSRGGASFQVFTGNFRGLAYPQDFGFS